MWYLFKYQNGSNPYIAKTNEERDRLLKKYKGKVVQISDKEYFIKECK